MKIFREAKFATAKVHSLFAKYWAEVRLKNAIKMKNNQV